MQYYDDSFVTTANYAIAHVTMSCLEFAINVYVMSDGQFQSWIKDGSISGYQKLNIHQLAQDYSLGVQGTYHIVFDNGKNTYQSNKTVVLDVELTYPQLLPYNYSDLLAGVLVILSVFIFVGLMVIGYIYWNRKKLPLNIFLKAIPPH